MAKVHGVAGEWARVKGSVVGLWPLFVGVFFAGASAMLMVFEPIFGLLALVFSLVYILWSLVRGLRHVERFFKGARGEEKVSGILERLPEAYHVFNDFAAGNSHIDHVVVGPSGVFAVETKFWNGAITIEDGHILLNGQLPSRSPLAQAIKEAELVKAELSRLGWNGQVTPVLVFASDTFVAHRANVRGAIVMNSNELMESFGSDRMMIPQAELERLVSVMENNQ